MAVVCCTLMRDGWPFFGFVAEMELGTAIVQSSGVRRQEETLHFKLMGRHGPHPMHGAAGEQRVGALQQEALEVGAPRTGVQSGHRRRA